jgi:FlaA1/EpsC-like NDP-sugar epimerase
MIASKLERLFNYRHRITRMDLEMPEIQAMKILISGGTGLVGEALRPFLQTQGHEVHLLSRSARAAPAR